MYFLEPALLKRWERKLLPFREKAQIAKGKYLKDYESYLPAIERCYARATYWHGTGRYHYSHESETRYRNIDPTKTIDVLESVVKNAGLMAHFDPWIKSDGEYSKTVSVATTRMHSHFFATLHQYKKNSLCFELGDHKFWIRFYFSALAALTLNRPFSAARELTRVFFTTAVVKNLQQWGSAIRKAKNGEVVSFRELVNAQDLYSDIPTNYPILFGISSKGIIFLRWPLPMIEKVEMRTLQKIPCKNFTHVEVPLANIAETKKFLEDRGLFLEIIPLEFGNIYLSKTPLQQLAYV